MRKFMLIPLAGAICMSMTGCPKLSGLLDFGHSAVMEEPAYDQQLSQDNLPIQDGSMINGYISSGDGTVIINPGELPGNTVATLAPEAQKPQESTTPPASTNQLVGTWSSVSRQGNYLIPHTIDFKADGTFYEYSSEYTHTSYDPQLFAGFEPGWEPLPMGFPGWFGTYTVSGNTVTQITTGDDIGSVGEPSTNTLTIDSLSDDTAVFNGQTYLKNFTPSNSDQHIEELCAALGVDLSV